MKIIIIGIFIGIIVALEFVIGMNLWYSFLISSFLTLLIGFAMAK